MRQHLGGFAADEQPREALAAGTGLFVPEEGRLYVAAPASGASPARVLIYRVN